MKGVSVRNKILVGLVVVMILGTAVVAVYLHESYSGGLDVAAGKAVNHSVAAWNDITTHSLESPTVASLIETGTAHMERMTAITGADYGLLIDKSALDPDEYAETRDRMGLADNWDERDAYVLVATTSEGLADKMLIEASADTVPEVGKVVGIENGACSHTCHGNVKGEGDFWGVAWSDDAHSRAHAVFPVTDAELQPIGLVYSIEDISPEADADRAAMMRALLLIGAMLLVAAVLIGVMLNALIMNRLDRMVAAMEDLSVQFAGGNFEARFAPDGSTDEIGRFQEFFARFVEVVSASIKSVRGD